MYPNETNCGTLSYLEPGELGVGQSKTVDIYAKYIHNFTGIYVRNGQRFEFTTESPAWQNGSRDTDAAGYFSDSIWDAGRRYPDFRMMALMVEVFAQNSVWSWARDYHKIGLARTMRFD